MGDSIIAEYHKRIDTLFGDCKKQVGTVQYQEKRKTQTLRIDHQNGVFIRDGVVCPEQWFLQKVRPLFLLKEAYTTSSKMFSCFTVCRISPKRTPLYLPPDIPAPHIFSEGSLL